MINPNYVLSGLRDVGVNTSHFALALGLAGLQAVGLAT